MCELGVVLFYTQQPLLILGGNSQQTGFGPRGLCQPQVLTHWFKFGLAG